MEWYNYVSCLFAGIFSLNTIPHFVQGVCGNKFPTPFSKPAGIGLSSPTVNVVWALFNAAVAILLAWTGNLGRTHRFSLVAFLAGFVFLALFSGAQFAKKDKE